MASPWETLAEIPKSHCSGGFYFFGLRQSLCNNVYLSVVYDLKVCFRILFNFLHPLFIFVVIVWEFLVLSNLLLCSLRSIYELIQASL
jgi:hypothetical protein